MRHALLGLLAAALPAAVSGAFVPAARAQDAAANAQQSAYRDSIAEESVRKQTDKVQAEITELLAELKLNGIQSADAQLLAEASGHLQSLSQQDMQKVINALQSASITTQDGERQQSLVNAYQGQKGVSLKLKSLAVQLAAQESQREVPSKLENLIARQSANLRQTGTLAFATPDHLDAHQKSTHDVVTAEQNAIGGEIDLLYTVLAARPAAPAIAVGAPADTSKAVLDAITALPLRATAQAAAQSTAGGPFADAVENQIRVRDLLTAALRAALSNTDAATQLAGVKAQLEQLIGDQKDLVGATKDGGLDGAVLAERQARISDRTAVTQALVKAVSPPVYQQLGTAQQAMAQSSTALAAAKHSADAAAAPQTVAAALQKAADLLDQQVAAAQKEQAMPPTDRLAALQQLQNALQQAQANPSAADLQKLQQDAMNVSPQAANQVAQAQDQMQQQQPDANAAAQALAQAQQDVQQQAAAMQQAAQQYQALAQAQQQLAQAQQQAQAASQQIQSQPNNLSTAAHDLQQAQNDVAQAQQAAQQSGNGTPQDPQQQQQQGGQQQSAQQNGQSQQGGQQQTAQQGGQSQQGGQQQQGGGPSQQALQQAADALKNATMQAVQAQGANAQASDQQAMAAMAQAQQGLAQAMAQVQQQAQTAMGEQMAQSQGQGQQSQQQQQQGGTQAMASDQANVNGVLSGLGGGGVAQVVGGLKPKDRDAISQYQAEKSPPEYAPMVQQYLKNLADSSSQGH